MHRRHTGHISAHRAVLGSGWVLGEWVVIALFLEASCTSTGRLRLTQLSSCNTCSCLQPYTLPSCPPAFPNPCSPLSPPPPAARCTRACRTWPRGCRAWGWRATTRWATRGHGAARLKAGRAHRTTHQQTGQGDPTARLRTAGTPNRYSRRPARRMRRQKALLPERTTQVVSSARPQQVALFAENSARWLLADGGVMAAGAADVVRGASAPPEELLFIAQHSGAVGALLQDGAALDRVLAAAQQHSARVPVGRGVVCRAAW